jgi:pyruvate, water dikinase
MHVDIHRHRHGDVRPAEPDGTHGFVSWLDDMSGFVVTTAAYLRALDQFGGRAALRARIADVDPHDPPALTRAAKTCQALVRSADMPAAVQRSVLDAYTHLACDAEPVVPVVVRASPTADDPAATSTAGKDVTFSGVCGGLQLVDRIIDCWASRWSPRVVADRAARKLTSEPGMAVVVQRMTGPASPISMSTSISQRT